MANAEGVSRVGGVSKKHTDILVRTEEVADEK